MNEDRHEKLHHNPEKGLSGAETDSDKKDSKKKDKKSKDRDNKKPENRPASFFKDDKKEVEERRTIFPAKDDKEEKQQKPSEDTKPKDKNEEETKEVKDDNAVENKEAEALTEKEARDVASHVTQARQEDVADNLTRVDQETPEEAEELAAAAFLTNLERHLGSGEDFTEEMLDQATEETLEDLQYETVDEDVKPEEATKPEDIHDDSDEEGDPLQPPSQQQHTVANQQHTPHLNNTGNTGGNNTQNGNVHSGGGSGNNGGGAYFPPPIFPGPPNIPNPPGGNGFYNSYQSNIAPPGVNTLISGTTYIDSDRSYRRRRAKHLLIGGIVGYMIGRRGGRKRTEKRLQPKIDKLEHEVSTLHDEIVMHEEKVRSIARTYSEQEQRLQKQLRTAKNVESRDEKASKAELPSPSAVSGKRTNQERIQHFVSRQQERQASQEKKQTTERMKEEGSIKKMAETHLTGLGIFVERRQIDGTEASRKRFEVMNEQELKAQAKKIVIDGVSVVSAYEAKRIDRDTLLEVTKRYWRNGSDSYETVFRNNLRPDESELKNHREKLEKAHNEKELQRNPPSYEQKSREASSYAKSLADGFYNRDPATLTTDEERHAYFQRFAEEEAQASEFGKLLKKAQNGSLMTRKTGWITLLFVLVIFAVIWLITGSLL